MAIGDVCISLKNVHAWFFLSTAPCEAAWLSKITNRFYNRTGMYMDVMGQNTPKHPYFFTLKNMP